MRYVSAVLAAEGTADDRFLPAVLERSLAEVAVDVFDTSVLVGPLYVYREHSGPPTVSELIDLMNGDDYGYSILMFHRDCGARFARTEQDWYLPFERSIMELSLVEEWVRVCPRRMTEAWMLADVEAVKSVIGHEFDVAGLGVPVTPESLEACPNPKEILERIALAAVPRRRRHSVPVADYYAALGESMSLAVLRSLPSFRYFETATRSSLKRIAGAG